MFSSLEFFLRQLGIDQIDEIYQAVMIKRNYQKQSFLTPIEVLEILQFRLHSSVAFFSPLFKSSYWGIPNGENCE